MDEKKQSMSLEARKRLALTCCREVVSFNESEILLDFEDSALEVKGRGLKVEEVSKTSGDVLICGESIDSLIFVLSHKNRHEGMLRRLFK